MTGYPSYRVYAAHHSQSAPPITLRRGEVTPKGGGFLGFGVLTVIVAVFIGSASFGAQKLYDSQLAKSTRVAVAPPAEAVPAAAGDGTAPAPFAMSLRAPAPAGLASPMPL